MPKKILIITDDAGESLEIYYAQQRFNEAGYKAVIAATQKKLLHGVIHDFEPDWNTYVERPGYRIPSDVAFRKVRVADYEAVMLIGGRAPEFLRHDDDVILVVAVRVLTLGGQHAGHDERHAADLDLCAGRIDAGEQVGGDRGPDERDLAP